MVTSPNFKFIEFIEFNENYGKTRWFHLTLDLVSPAWELFEFFLMKTHSVEFHEI